MRQRLSATQAYALFGGGLLLISACEGVQIGDDALVQHLSPGQDQACRTAVRDALAEKNVSDDWIRRVHYQAVRTGNRIRGFEAWVFPEEGRGNLVVELTIDCRVTGIWARGMR
jgi:hypothetical protein